jgi:amidase
VEALKSGEVTPLDLIASAEARHHSVDAKVNSLVVTCFERAREGARALMQRPIADRGSLCGLPIAIKCLNDVAGVRTTYGSPIFADNVPTKSDLMVETLEESGGLVIGLTNSPEFGAGGNTFNEVHGTTRNPWNGSLSAGGSSGGSAVALATGQVWLASGSDLGGSLRLPASHCRIVGLRPSPGRVPSGPGEQVFDTLSVDGPMARDVADVALMLDAMLGWRREIPHALPASLGKGGWLAQSLSRKKPKRIAISMDLGGVSPIDPMTRAAVAGAAEALAGEGIEMVEAQPDFSGTMEAFQVLRALGYVASTRQLLADHRGQLKPEVIWNVEQGLALKSEDIASAMLRRSRLYRDCEEFLRGVDLLMVPAACTPPTAIEERWVREVDGQAFSDYVGWLAITAVVTLTGLPVLAIPAGFTPDRRPVGVQLIGQPQGEAALLSHGAAIEAILDVRPGAPIDPR